MARSLCLPFGCDQRLDRLHGRAYSTHGHSRLLGRWRNKTTATARSRFPNIAMSAAAQHSMHTLITPLPELLSAVVTRHLITAVTMRSLPFSRYDIYAPATDFHSRPLFGYDIHAPATTPECSEPRRLLAQQSCSCPISASETTLRICHLGLATTPGYSSLSRLPAQ